MLGRNVTFAGSARLSTPEIRCGGIGVCFNLFVVCSYEEGVRGAALLLKRMLRSTALINKAPLNPL